MKEAIAVDNEAVDRKDRLDGDIKTFLEQIENLKGELIETFGRDRIGTKILENCEADQKAASHTLGSENLIVLQLRRNALEAGLRELKQERERLVLEQKK